MGSPLGPSLANVFLSYYEKNWLNNCPQGFKPVFYRRYVDDIFLLFKSNDHLKYFQDFLNSCHINMSFSMETEKENKLSFLDVEVIREQGKFTTTVYRKPTFSGVYSNFESFLPSVYKFGMVYTLVYRCFRISSNWTQFHTELTFLKGIFRKNGEHIGVSPLTGKKVKPSNNSAICDHLLHCNFLPSFDNFSVLAYENKKYLLEIKESLLIMRDKPSLNRNINSAPLYLFDKVS